MMRSGLHRYWFGAAVFAAGVLVLARTQVFYGALLRGWDAQHYYAGARSLVFDADVDITNDLEQTPFPAPFDRDADGYFERVSRNSQGRILSHYPVGLSLLESPFLALGYGVRQGLCALGICSTRPAGYSDVEIWSVALGLLAIFAIGAQVLHEILRPVVPQPWREIALVGAWMGTSLFYYSSVFPFMAHAIGFTLVVGSVSIGTSILAGRPRRFVTLGAALGSLFLVRPQQLTLVLPMALILAPLRQRQARLWIGWATVGLIVLLGCMALQAAVYSRMAGAWTLNAYATGGGEFDWWHPALSGVLLSTTSGLLWISPAVLLAAFGFATTPARSIPRPFAALALQAAIQIYVIACWPYGQGDTFGTRMWAECAGVAACGLALLFLRANAPWRLLLTVVAVVCVAWTNRLLFLYLMGRLRPDMSHADCLRLALGL